MCKNLEVHECDHPPKIDEETFQDATKEMNKEQGMENQGDGKNQLVGKGQHLQ